MVCAVVMDGVPSEEKSGISSEFMYAADLVFMTSIM